MNKVSQKYHKKLVLCGHSKGAHLAMNSMLRADNKLSKKIISVYCFDGPGINKKLYENIKISDNLSKIVSYIKPLSKDDGGFPPHKIPSILY